MAPLRVVLVDDHEMVLQGLTTILGRFLGRVRVVGQALDADAALKLAGTLHPDIVLCDVRLKGSSGLDLCQKILERDPAAKVVLLSAYELGGGEFTSMASVPMASRPAGLAGVLNVHTRSRRIFAERDVVLLTAIGSLFAGAVHQARLHRRLAAREHALERFAERVIAAQEAERRRLAGDIHDGISQRLISLSYHLDAAADALRDAPEFTAEQLVLARRMIDLTLNEARAAISGLRPPVLDDLGLPDGLASLARSIGGVQVSVEADECALPEHVEIALYRIAQEALQNVVKHAGASGASVELRCDPGLVSLRITDDGAGFYPDAAARGFGLSGMAERAELVGGRLDVRSAPGRGTTIEARIPVTPPR